VVELLCAPKVLSAAQNALAVQHVTQWKDALALRALAERAPTLVIDAVLPQLATQPRDDMWHQAVEAVTGANSLILGKAWSLFLQTEQSNSKVMEMASRAVLGMAGSSRGATPADSDIAARLLPGLMACAQVDADVVRATVVMMDAVAQETLMDTLLAPLSQEGGARALAVACAGLSGLHKDVPLPSADRVVVRLVQLALGNLNEPQLWPACCLANILNKGQVAAAAAEQVVAGVVAATPSLASTALLGWLSRALIMCASPLADRCLEVMRVRRQTQFFLS
jgi:hypothetical protein